MKDRCNRRVLHDLEKEFDHDLGVVYKSIGEEDFEGLSTHRTLLSIGRDLAAELLACPQERLRADVRATLQRFDERIRWVDRKVERGQGEQRMREGWFGGLRRAHGPGFSGTKEILKAARDYCDACRLARDPYRGAQHHEECIASWKRLEHEASGGAGFSGRRR